MSYGHIDSKTAKRLRDYFAGADKEDLIALVLEYAPIELLRVLAARQELEELTAPHMKDATDTALQIRDLDVLIKLESAAVNSASHNTYSPTN